MPSKNRIKLYVENGYYHIYNRGVEKRLIFQDNQDYRVFLHYLKIYLSPLSGKSGKGDSFTNLTRRRPLNNFHQVITLLTYCLMPNHFHLLLKQKPANGIEKFMRSLGTKYVQYFNKRYERVGPLFQDIYKAVLIKTDEQLLHLSRYIHLNSLKDNDKDGPLPEIPFESYSSYGDYLGKRKTNWIHPEEILNFFKTAQRTSLKDILSYQSFIEDYPQPPEEILGELTLECL
jgi:putative transposase